MDLSSLGLSWHCCMPVLTAWRTPVAALLVTAGVGVSMSNASGAFMVCAQVVAAAGATDGFRVT